MTDRRSESNLRSVSRRRRFNVNNIPALLSVMNSKSSPLSSIVYSGDRVHFTRIMHGVVQRVTVRWRSEEIDFAPALLNHLLNNS